MELLPQISRFSTRALTLPRHPPPRIIIRPLFMPPPAAPVPLLGSIQQPQLISPLPADLIPVIQAGVGKVPSVFTTWATVIAAGGGGGGGATPIYAYFSSATTYALPSVPVVNEWIRVQDNLGLASPTNPLTVLGAPINGRANFVFNQPFQAADFVWSGTQWGVF